MLLKKGVTRGLGIFLLVGTVMVAWGQESSFGEVRQHYLGLDDGLLNRRVNNSAYDQRHLLWLATESGLARYDGYEASPFSHFPQRFKGEFRASPDGTLIALPKGLGDSIEIFDPTLLQASGTRLTETLEGEFGGAVFSRAGRVFFLCGDGIFVYRRGDRPQRYHTLEGSAQRGDQLIYADSTHYLLYQALGNQLIHRSPAETKEISLPFTEPYDLLYLDRGGRVWISGGGKLYHVDPGTATPALHPGLPAGWPVNYVSEDNHHRLMLGHLGETSLRFHDLVMIENGQTYSLDWILQRENRILTIAGSDFRRDIRLNTHGGLIVLSFFRQEVQRFRNYLYRQVKPGQFGDVMRGFTADNQGNVYTNKDSRDPYWFRIAAEAPGVDTLVMRDNSGGVANQFGCGSELINYQGDIYGMSCYRGEVDTGHVYRYRPSTGEWKRWAMPETNQVTRWIIPGRTQDELLVVTEHSKNHAEGKLYYFYPDRDAFLPVLPAGPETHIRGWARRVVKDSSRQCYWLGSVGGLYRFDYVTERLHSYHFHRTRQGTISDILVRKNGQLLLGTIGAGLYNFNPETAVFSHVGGIMEDGSPDYDPKKFLFLPSNDIAGLRLAAGGELLIATFNGLVIHWDGKQSVFTTAHGLPNNEFNTPSLFYNPKDERWYAGGINGFTSFKIEDLLPKPSPFRPVLLRYRVLDERVGYESVQPITREQEAGLVIDPSVVYFTLEYTIPDLFAQGDRLYQTRLVGYDPDWHPMETANEVRYTRLPPGRYTFQLRAIDGFGRESAEIVSLPITVLKPWYNQAWFYLLLVLTAIGAFYQWQDNRIRQMRKGFEHKRQLQNLELRAIRQQMNPHFISNAMNAIREFIRNTNDLETATGYLTDFARLMRLFLESSRKQFIPIGEEIDMLRRYVGLEQLRFPGKFDFELYVDPALDLDMDEVPSLLLQPIVENAINHGLGPIHEGGKLWLRFELRDALEEVIVCTVTDNGVGRKAAGAAQLGREHVSRATQILEDRRSLLREHESVTVNYQTEDLFPDREHTGTRVTILIAANEQV